MTRIIAVLASCVCVCSALAQRVFDQAPLADGRTLKYALVLPENFDPAKAYTTLLALPPGAQDEEMVDQALKLYWESQAKSLGWVVVSPAVPKGGDFAEMDAAVFDPLFAAVRAKVKIAGDRMHLAGVSNGGRAAFHLAVQRPQQFDSMVVLPGFPPSESDEKLLGELKEVRVSMLVGALDEGWLDRSRRSLELLKNAGVEASLEVVPEQKHVLNVPGPKLFGMFDMDPLGAAKRDVARTLDDFHDAAAKADEARYFSHFTPEGVFIGTDATERWTKEEFRVWAKPYFARGTAWKYTPKSRHVFVSENTAWFDEMLDNPRLEECRGTGVLLRDETGVWRIAQYHLVIPVPNELADDLVKRGKALKK